jgi:hypothetical protein
MAQQNQDDVHRSDPASVGQEPRTIGMWLVTWGKPVHGSLLRCSAAAVAVESGEWRRRETSTPLCPQRGFFDRFGKGGG